MHDEFIIFLLLTDVQKKLGPGLLPLFLNKKPLLLFLSENLQISQKRSEN